ncbi:hypothetical protein EYR38_006882 [Pleurotus pulmonarius]|nr:hypothetical protein EYR38_006882 [Pleurotus pulmonarius]
MPRQRSGSQSSSDSSSSGHGQSGTTRGSQAAARMTMAVILGVTQSVLFRMNDDDNERTHLLGQGDQNGHDGTDGNKETQPSSKTRAVVWGVLTLLFVIGLVPLLAFQNKLPEELFPWLGRLPSDPMLAALSILDKAPVIVRDGRPLNTPD